MFVCFVFLFQSLRAYSVEAPEFGRSFPATSARPAGEHWAAEPASVHKAEEASFPANQPAAVVKRGECEGNSSSQVQRAHSY